MGFQKSVLGLWPAPMGDLARCGMIAGRVAAAALSDLRPAGRLAGAARPAWILGRRILRTGTPWVLAFLLGWGILRLLALIPIVGGLIWFAAVVFGLGALTVTIWRARSSGQAAPAPA